ncbi:MAG: hypothetical protein ACEY3F_07125 [Wolbachia sp.]
MPVAQFHNCANIVIYLHLGKGVIPVFLSLSSQCPDYLDPGNLTLNKWLHNKNWIPDWNDTLLNRHTAIHSRYPSR